MREDAAWSPILREQGALEELAAIGVEIIRNARNELYLSMRFLDVALNGLFPVADNSIKGIGTDGTLLSFETGYICGWYRRNPVYVNRMILHETFHCLFVHPWSRKKRTEEYWNLACDIAVESLIDGIHKPCVHLPMSPVRAEFYGRLRKKIKVLNAESIYHTMQEMELSEIEYERLCREFCRDDHSRWEKEDEKKSPNPNRNRKNDWDDKREKMQAEMEAFSNEAADDSRELMDQLAVENRERYDYRKFLHKFSVLKETVQIDPDAFDYVFYNYGMQLYGNMPLIEPLETKEVRRIEDFVVVIDTSMSCSGELVKKFFIVRIAWVFGVNGKNFIKTMLRIGKERGAASVVDDQIGSPTYTYDLARLLVDMIQTDKYGRYHATNEGLCSWYEFACEIFRAAGMDVKVTPVHSDEYPAAKAKRPMNSRMSKEKLTENGFERLPEGKDAVARYLKEITW